MATLTETAVRVTLVIRNRGGEMETVAQAESLTADGTVVRRLDRDIHGQLSAARQQGIADLLADVEARLRTIWNIS